MLSDSFDGGGCAQEDDKAQHHWRIFPDPARFRQPGHPQGMLEETEVSWAGKHHSEELFPFLRDPGIFSTSPQARKWPRPLTSF